MDELFDRLTVALADRYAIQRELGRGGMAVVFLAHDQKLGRDVALKVIRPELATSLGSERFLREVAVAAQLTHPNILGLYDRGEADGLLYYTMPVIEGETLRDRLDRERQLSIDEALAITREVAEALEHAHGKGIVHRDIKPENILLQDGHAVVADFGIAKAVAAAGGTQLTETGMAVGTPAYMSPEQASGRPELDGRTDVYALGCVLYEMLSGETPYTAATPQAVIAKKLSAPLPRISVVREAVPPAVEHALLKALARDAVDRFATAGAFVEALTAEVMPVPPRAGRWRGGAVAVGVVVVAVVAGGTWRYLHPADPGPPPEDRPYTVLAAVEGNADSSLRDIVGSLLRNRLDAESHVLRTVPPAGVRSLLRLMERPLTAMLDEATAREVAERAGVTTIVLPRVDVLGGGVVLQVRVEDVAGGHLRAEATRQALSQAVLVETVGDLIQELRRELGESRAALANTRPLPMVLTPSLEALRKFQQGTRAHVDYRFPEARALYQEALALDPEFAAARRSLGAVGGGDGTEAEWRRAMETPERLSAVDRQDIEAYLKFWGDFGVWDESILRTGREFNITNRLFLFGYVDSALTRRMNDIRWLARDRRRFDPEDRLGDLADGQAAYLAFGVAWPADRLGELESLRDSLRMERTPSWDFKMSLGMADFDHADSLLELYPSMREKGPIFFRFLDAGRGRIGAAQADAGSGALSLEIVYGIPVADTVSALAGRGYRPVLHYAVHGVRAALRKDTAEVKRVLARFQAARDSATSALFEHWYEPVLALLEAELAMHRGDWPAAADRLAPVVQKLGLRGHRLSEWRDEHLWWVMADVYMNLGQPDSAIAQLEAIVARPPQYAYSPAQFKLGQLYAQAGNREEALEHFGKFLDAFTDPDPEYAWMVTEAGAEVERLGQGW